MTALRVVVVDDHHLFRHGVRALLDASDGYELVGEAADTAAAIAVVAEARPDVVLMDLTLPGEGGVTATRAVVEAGTAKAVLVLTMHGDAASVRRALDAGAKGYLLKESPGDAILAAIATVASGQAVLDPVAVDALLAHGARAGRAFPALTDREYEVLERIARGLRNDAIAARLGISVKTVQNTVSSIFLKLGVRDRAEAIASARDAGVGV